MHKEFRTTSYEMKINFIPYVDTIQRSFNTSLIDGILLTCICKLNQKWLKVQYSLDIITVAVWYRKHTYNLEIALLLDD